MKTLQNYIYEESLDNDILITEGFWKKLGSLFGFSTKKLSNSMKGWKDDIKTGFATGQYLAVKSKDSKIKKAAEEQAKAAEESQEKLLQATKDNVELLAKTIKNQKFPHYALQQYRQLRDLSKELKDEEGQKLAESFKKTIDNQWPDDLNKLEKEVEKEKGKVAKVVLNKDDNKDEKGEEKGEEGSKEEKEVKKQAETETTNTIKENIDLFKQLAKAANINGEGLRDYVSKYILTRNADGKLKTKEEIEKISDDEVLATCIIVCGAVMTNNNDTFARIVKAIYKGEDGKNGLKKAMELVKK